MVAVVPLKPERLTDFDLDGGTARAERIALVTGAGSGIGFGLVQQLLKDDRYRTIFAACRAPAEHPELLKLADDECMASPTRRAKVGPLNSVQARY